MISLSLVIIRLWRYRNVNGGRAILCLAVGLFIWSFGYFLESIGNTLESQNFFNNISAIGVLLVPTAWLIFTINYTTGDHIITHWRVIPFIIFPIITTIFLWHPDLRYLIWQSESLVQFDHISIVDRTFGPFFWVFISYSYIFVISGVITLLLKLQRTKLYLRQVILVITAVCIPVIGTANYVFSIFPMIHRDFTPVFFTISVIIFSFALFRYNLFEVIPFAHSHLIQQMQDSILVFDPANHLIQANQKAMSFLDLSINDVGKKIEDITTLSDSFKKLISTNFDKSELTIKSLDQEYILEVQSIKLLDSKNRHKGSIILLHNITERKKVEEILRTSDAALKSMHDAVIITDNEWIVKQWNNVSEELFCVPAEEAIGKFIGDLVEMIEEYPGQNIDKIDKLIHDRQHKATQQFHTLKGDIWTDVHSQAVEANGEQIGWIMLFEDITQQKRFQEQMLAQDRLASIGKVTSGIAHEINNPLSIIKGIIELTLDSDISEQLKSDMNIANEEIDRASNIIKNLLTFSRNQSSRKKQIDINELILKTLEIRKYQQKQNNIHMVTELISNMLKIWGSETQLRQVLINIIINAEFFLTKKDDTGIIKINTTRHDECIQISISDNGPGISEEIKKHIFDPFYTSKSIGEGTGLGLSICYGIIQDHEGTIDVESTPGKGTTFIISLPIYAK